MGFYSEASWRCFVVSEAQRVAQAQAALCLALCQCSFSFPAFLGAYLLYSWGTQEFERLKRKNPADYENDQ